MPNPQPIVTVITRTYNSSQLIEASLDSLLAQTIADRCEFLVIDDGSTDNTVKLLQEAYGDRIRLELRGRLSREFRGPMRNLNFGISVAKGKLVMIHDHDDELDPTCIEKLLHGLGAGISIADEVNRTDHNPPFQYPFFAYCDYRDRFPKNRGTVEVKTGPTPGLIWNTVVGGILFFRDLLIRLDCYDVNLKFPEYDLLLKIFASGVSGVHVPEVLWSYHRAPGSMTVPEYVKEAIEQLWHKYHLVPPIRSYALVKPSQELYRKNRKE